MTPMQWCQARSLACVSGVRIGVSIKWIMYLQEKTELSIMSQRPRLCSTKISGDLSLATNIKQE